MISHDASFTSKKLESDKIAQQVQKAQREVDEITYIMRANVVKVMERDHKIEDLNKRAEALQQAASQFKLQSHKLKRKRYRANVKTILSVISVFVVIFFIAYALLGKKTTENPSNSSNSSGDSIEAIHPKNP